MRPSIRKRPSLRTWVSAGRETNAKEHVARVAGLAFGVHDPAGQHAPGLEGDRLRLGLIPAQDELARQSALRVQESSPSVACRVSNRGSCRSMPPAEVSSPSDRNPCRSTPRPRLPERGLPSGPSTVTVKDRPRCEQEVPAHRHRARCRVDLGEDMMFRGNDAVGISLEVPVFRFVFERIDSRPQDILIPSRISHEQTRAREGDELERAIPPREMIVGQRPSKSGVVFLMRIVLRRRSIRPGHGPACRCPPR